MWMTLRHLRKAVPQSTHQFKNKSVIVRSITVSMSSPQQEQPKINGHQNGLVSNGESSAPDSEVSAGNLVQFLELVGNLKVSVMVR